MLPQEGLHGGSWGLLPLNVPNGTQMAFNGLGLQIMRCERLALRAQVLSNLLDWGMEPQTALNAPRWSLYGVDSAEGPVTVERSTCAPP